MRQLDCDVLVIGSGASGLAAAVTAAHHGLKVIVAEKHVQLGGTSAWSGGWLWVPGNPLAIADGQLEQDDAPARYLRSQVHRDKLDCLQSAYLERAPEMVDFFQRHTRVQFQSGTHMPDMRDADGSARGGRSLCALPFDGRELGPWLQKLRPPLDIVSLFGMGIAGGADLRHFFDSRRSPRSAWHVASRLLRHGRDCLLHGRGLHLVNGNALVARLLRSALDLDVEVRTGSPARRLVMEDGAVRGAILGGADEETRILTRRGVVLACGGFPHDQDRQARLFSHTAHWSAAPPENSGDGLSLGEASGGQVATDLASAAAWAPVSLVPRRDGSLGHFPHLIDRAKPGFIAVRNDGRRFTNEADCYHDFMNDLYAGTAAGKPVEAWLIADRQARQRYGIGWAKPLPFADRHYQRLGYLVRANTLEELAERCGIDREGLRQTVQRFNQFAAQGEDPDFQRGASAYNRAQGEASHAPNPSLRPLRGPFYAVKLHPGSLGTFAGLRCDEQARVLDASESAIPGLFAVGNDMNSVMAGHYPSGGITLGPGMTFGYLAGLALAEEASALSAAGNPAPPRRSSACGAA
ncbi:FAD-dependent oxidoreductase [Pseudomonas sp. LRF_L74]|uniref:FAD-dependent oxidoreductase n=1 Tax=Pseudomonas sp. LRF_L74 TaxID=3369422 RepID=UPI003F638E3D